MKRLVSLCIAVSLVAACSNAATVSQSPTTSASAEASGSASEPPATVRPVAPSPSPSPSHTSAPAATPPPLPSGNGWPFTAQTSQLGIPEFGPDGTIYVDVTAVVDDPNRGTVTFARLVALDPSGRMRAGWPVELGLGWLTGFAVGGDGSVAAVVCSAVGAPSSMSRDCRVHRLDPDGREYAGFPVLEPNVSWCDEPLIASDNTIYVTCAAGDESTIRVSAVGAGGKLKPGWPVVLETTLALMDTQLASDGTLYVASTTGRWALRIHALAADGHARFAATLPEGARYQYRDRLYLVAPDGTLRVWWYEGDVDDICVHADRTVFSALGSDGRTLPGWPKTVAGVATAPVLDANGTVYVASAKGGMSEGPASVVAFEGDGDTKVGWPVALAGLRASCPEMSIRLAVSPAGTLNVLENVADGGIVLGVDPAGSTVPGWTYRAEELDWGCPADCAPEGPPNPPVFSADGTAYLTTGEGYSEAPSQILALDRQGRLRPGWPYPLSVPSTDGSITNLTMSPTGLLYVSRVSSGVVLFPLGPSGEPAP